MKKTMWKISRKIRMMKSRVLSFLLEKLFGVKEGEILPDNLKWLNSLFFPIQSLAMKYSPVKYDFRNQELIAFGIRYSIRLFEGWSQYGLGIGEHFTLIGRKDNMISLRREMPQDQVIEQIEDRIKVLKAEMETKWKEPIPAQYVSDSLAEIIHYINFTKKGF